MSKIRISDLIRIGEWLPDQPDTNNPGSNNVENVTVQGEDYKPFKAFGATIMPYQHLPVYSELLVSLIIIMWFITLQALRTNYLS